MTQLQLLDPSSGEIVHVLSAGDLLDAAGLTDLREATVLDLATFTDDLETLRRVAHEAKGMAGRELIARMDRDGQWTIREDGWKLTSSSPEAGTTVYDTDLLRVALGLLVDNDVISQHGADSALELIAPTVTVPWALLHDASWAIDGELDPVKFEILREALSELTANKPRESYRQRPAGIKALLKVPAARDAIMACRVHRDPPERTVRVRRTEG